MIRPLDAIRASLRRSHVTEDRLDQLARAAGPSQTPEELAHLEGCPNCRRLLAGFSRADDVLAGRWADRALDRGPGVPSGSATVKVPGVPTRRTMGTRGALAGLALVVIVVAGAAWLGSRGPTEPGASVAATRTAGQVGTGVVATLPSEPAYVSYSWAPDGEHLYVSDTNTYTGRLYRRSGQLVAAVGPGESWLDASHLIDDRGYVWAVTDKWVPRTGDYVYYLWSVANGHGAAAVVLSVAACTCDPEITWYRDGSLHPTGEAATPIGWSTDGRLFLEGHMNPGGMDLEMSGWKGSVEIVGLASGRVLATVPDVRGAVGFNPSSTRLAAQSDSNVEIVAVAGGSSATISGARFLGWLDDDRLYVLAGEKVELVDLGAGGAGTVVPSSEWQIPSPAGPRLVVGANGAVERIVAADGSTLLDLSSSSLSVSVPPGDGYVGTSLRSPLEWWSPDGGMLALKSTDGSSIVLISVNPNEPGQVGTALPTPIPSPSALALVESTSTSVPGGPDQLVFDGVHNAFWFVCGEAGPPLQLCQYDIDAGALSKRSMEGTSYGAAKARLALAPDGAIWIGGGNSVLVYDPATDGLSSVALPGGSDVQPDPATGKADPWVSGIAFDGSGNAYVARNWVRSLVVVDASLQVLDRRIDISDGFPMTGDIAVAGGRVYLVVDPSSPLVLGAVLTESTADTKVVASHIAAVGDRLLVAGEPPMWMDNRGGGAMLEPVLSSADLVAAGPDGSCVLYSSKLGEAQWRDKDGHVSGQAVFAETAPAIQAIALDGQGRLWVVIGSGSGGSELVRADAST
jgi:hypothetical protein